ncbi:MAG: FkbM family methyltransferase [Actinomycetota bacterium]|nr:FkbM family methyltransferase [Actinomycetota bacterium]
MRRIVRDAFADVEQRLIEEQHRTADRSVAATNHAVIEELHRTASHSVAATNHAVIEELHRTTRHSMAATADAMHEAERTARRQAATLARIAQFTEATARRVVVPLSDDTLLVRTVAGYVVCPTSDEALIAMLVEEGDVERGTRRLIEALVTPGAVVVDIGANIGLHTLAAARAVGPTGRVIAFEPFPLSAECLRRTLAINGCSSIVELHETAVSDVDGQAVLHLGNWLGHHSLGEPASVPAGGPAAIDVPVVRFDSVVAATQRVDLVKIDVEGLELQVVRGLEATIGHNPDIAVIVEFGPAHLQRSSVTPDAWLATFERLGLVWMSIDPSTGHLDRQTIAQLVERDSSNLLFARPDSPAWLRGSNAADPQRSAELP